MPQPPKEDALFSLVKSLTKSEKRYFNLFTQMGTGRSHAGTLDLFKAIEQAKTLDDGHLKKVLNLTGAQLAVRKTRLFDLIVKSLATMNGGKTLDSKIRILIGEVEVLKEKQLITRARKRLRKALLLAEKFELEEYVLRLLGIQHSLFVLQPNEQENEFIARLQKSEEEALKRMMALRGYHRIHDQIRSLARRSGRIKTDDIRNKYAALMDDPLMSGPPETFLQHSLYDKIRAIYETMQGNYNQAIACYEQSLQRWRSNPEKLICYADLFLGTVNNFLNVVLTSDTHRAQFPTSMERINQIPPLPALANLKFKRIVYFQELIYRVNFEPFDHNLGFFPEMEAWLKSNHTYLAPSVVLVFYYNLTLYYFAYGKNTQAISWLNRIRNYPNSDAREDIRDFARIFEVVIQNELGEFDYQSYILRSAYYYFKKNELIQEYETVLLKLLKGLEKNPDDRSSWETFQKDLEVIRAVPGNREPLGFQLLLVLAEARIRQVPISEVYLEKISTWES